jgi:beta-lactamase superfamily II metal-dependent hydrolase
MILDDHHKDHHDGEDEIIEMKWRICLKNNGKGENLPTMTKDNDC